MKTENEKIINKIKNLLKLAENGNNDEESQTAFALAQKLMIKNHIKKDDVTLSSKTDNENIIMTEITPRKARSIWWEDRLANTIAKSFRVELIKTRMNKFGKSSFVLKFLGLEEDVELAVEVFLLAHDALIHYTERHARLQKRIVKDSVFEPLNRTEMAAIRNSYREGFINGIDSKLKSQVANLSESTALIIQTPHSVVDYMDNILKVTHRTVQHNYARGMAEPYQAGFKEGSKVDMSKSTIDKKVQQW